MLKEFKEFASRGSLLDLAVGLVLGTAFTKIVNSLVNDIIMPPIGMLLGGVDFANLFINLSGVEYATLAAAQEAGAAVISYGVFINAIIDFVIVAFAMFLIVRQVNRLKRAEEETAPTVKSCPYCKSDIALEATRCPHCTSEVA
ncbi:MAG: large-conductance mechanosensitive channel protein MscL [Syntrophomonadaceae bacterium]|nr:large-conductance mechanosensitive channel protein MscL [Syntrophomonadaceae bacterium]